MSFDRKRALDIVLNGTDVEKTSLINEIAKHMETKRFGLVFERGGDEENSAFPADEAVKLMASAVPYPVYKPELSLTPAVEAGGGIGG